MDINIGTDGDVVIMELNGDLVASTADQLKEQVAKLSDKNFTYVVLEMSRLTFMDSSGLGACVAVHRMLADRKGMLVCAKPSDPIAKVFRITRADKKLTIAASKEEGVRLLLGKIIEARQR